MENPEQEQPIRKDSNKIYFLVAVILGGEGVPLTEYSVVISTSQFNIDKETINFEKDLNVFATILS